MSRFETMSTQLDDGGPAFPIPPCGTGDPRDGMTTGHDGATLRDVFAWHALAGYMALQDGRIFPGDPGDRAALEEWRAKVRLEDARMCYDYADAMLAARREKQ